MPVSQKRQKAKAQPYIIGLVLSARFFLSLALVCAVRVVKKSGFGALLVQAGTIAKQYAAFAGLLRACSNIFFRTAGCCACGTIICRAGAVGSWLGRCYRGKGSCVS